MRPSIKGNTVSEFQEEEDEKKQKQMPKMTKRGRGKRAGKKNEARKRMGKTIVEAAGNNKSVSFCLKKSDL